ncbi:protein-methionine-sulfoxide reductase heme-binding subunit MsrQ [Aliiroseovarius sp. YM-037]|uniref:protein-methionine-sulfoxide reductase heme-binding subunit MsrQ n=1 Tax=Aliiroseovarius sp. YM-037 TaxID=3341728 RepID=UPI003A812B84
MVSGLNNSLRRVPAWTLYIVGAIPFVWLVIQLFTGALGVDPVKVMEHRLGELGLQFLVVGLAVTPLRKFTGINIVKFRRPIGVVAFFYILAHLLVWLLLDIQLLWGQIWADILKRPYITIGMAGFLLLLPLALTSNNWSVRKLGPVKWRKLHRLTYLAIPIGAIHFVMVVKGWQVEPFIYLAVVLALLALRIRLRMTREASRA